MKHNSKFIPGIYNYCDRWCERCSFTTRCRNFESTSRLSSEQLDMGNEAFWKSISGNFKNAAKMLKKAANKFGIDLNNIPEEDVIDLERERKLRKQSAKEHPLARVTMAYLNEAERVLDNNPMLKEKREEMIRELEAGQQNAVQVVKDAVTIKDCLEVIYWYLFFIHVKFQRALQGQLEDDDREERNGYQRDCDGSAKIALIAARRSLEAWISINDLIPGYEDELIPLLAKLQQIIRLGNEIFPRAARFIRPGFDES